MQKNINITKAIYTGINNFKNRPGFFLGVSLAFILISSLANIISNLFLDNSATDPKTVNYSLLLVVVGNLISLAMIIGMIKISLKTIRKQEADFKTLFESGDCFLKGVGGGIFYICLVAFYLLMLLIIGKALGLTSALMVILAVILLIPTVLTAVRYRFWIYLIVDHSLKPIDALRASDRMTKSVLLKLVLFDIVCQLLNFFGACALAIGLLVTVPITAIAKSSVYQGLLENTDLSDFGIIRSEDYTEENQKSNEE